VVSEDLSPTRRKRLAERADLGASAVNGRLVERLRCVFWAVGEVDVSHRFLAQPGNERLVVGVADAKAERPPIRASLVETAP
jgi:hypothetical protein